MTRKRADWTEGFEAHRNVRILALANLAEEDSATGRSRRWGLLGRNTFNATLDNLVENGRLDDLTDAERAYCVGWAAYARQLFGGTDPGNENGGDAIDKALRDAIGAAIAEHSGPGPSGSTVTG